jgi:hypothetical protein
LALMKYAVRERGGEAVALLMRDADEEDLLRGRAAEAVGRVSGTVRELLLALLALAGGVLLAEALLARARREAREQSEGAAVGAELSVLALEKVVAGGAGRILGRSGVLSLYGARPTPGLPERVAGQVSVRLAARTRGGGFDACGQEVPEERVVLGARLVPAEGEERLLWCVKRLRKHGGDGAWRFVDESRDPFAGAALIRFFSEPRIPPALPPAREEPAGKGGSKRARRRGAMRGGASRKGAALVTSA